MSTQAATVSRERQVHLTLWDRIDIIKNKRFFPLAFPLIMLVVVFAIFAVLTGGSFLRSTVLMGIFNQSLITGTMATAVCFIYTTGNIDFSVGSVMGLACTLGAMSYEATGSMAVALVVTVLGGTGLMIFNCTMSVSLGVKPVMVAIVAQSIYGAITTVLVGANPIGVDYTISKSLEDNYRYIAFIVYFALVLLIFHGTAVGRKLRFIGGNETCAVQTGINVFKAQYIAFLLAGIGVGLAGTFQLIRTANVAYNTGSGMGMDVMLATVLGGMSIFGGTKSNAYAGLIGAITVTMLDKGLLMMEVPSTLIQGVRGALFLLLVFLNSERQKTLPSRQQF